MLINKHGSFYIRNGWPTKIIDAIQNDEHIFSPNNELQAVDEIGVGRVMIKAMRYWSSQMGISSEEKTKDGIACNFTELGELISQYDLYCQDIGTLWLLHRNLAKNRDSATAWYWAFNEMNSKTFSKDSFSSDFYAFLQKNGSKYTKQAVEKEFDCFKNTYVSDKAFDLNRIILEDTVPFFAPLKLIHYKGDGQFEMQRTKASSIPANIALYCIISDNIDHLNENMQIGIDQLLEGNSQIGKYFNISYATLLEILQTLENMDKLILVNNFGNRHIQLKQTNADQIIEEYFRKIER